MSGPTTASMLREFVGSFRQSTVSSGRRLAATAVPDETVADLLRDADGGNITRDRPSSRCSRSAGDFRPSDCGRGTRPRRRGPPPVLLRAVNPAPVVVRGHARRHDEFPLDVRLLESWGGRSRRRPVRPPRRRSESREGPRSRAGRRTRACGRVPRSSPLESRHQPGMPNSVTVASRRPFASNASFTSSAPSASPSCPAIRLSRSTRSQRRSQCRELVYASPTIVVGSVVILRGRVHDWCPV